MDYSLLLGINDVSNDIIVRIIDYGRFVPGEHVHDWPGVTQLLQVIWFC